MVKLKSEASTSVSYKSFFVHETSRMIFEGALNTDIVKAYNQIECEDDWIEYWSKAGEEHEIRGKAAAKNGNKETAFSSLFLAAQYHRLAQFHIYPALGGRYMEQKAALLEKSINLYDTAISSNESCLIQNVSIPYYGTEYKGYIHYPENYDPTGSYPCVICVPGLGHNCISLHNWCKEGTKRGFIVLAVDGPGYGSARVLKGLELNHDDFNSYLSVVVDYLSVNKNIDSERIGILGDCYGGYLSIRGTAHDSRIKACSVLEPILSYGEEQIKGKPLPDLITYHLEDNEHYRVEEIYKDLLAKGAKISGSVMITHAQTDKLIPIDVAKKVSESVKGDSYLEVVEGSILYENYINNHYNTVLDELHFYVPNAWDWLLSKLNK